MLNTIIRVIVSLLVLAIAYISIMHGCIVYTARKEPPANVEYMYVLGAQLWGEQMSLSLHNRMVVALAYLRANSHTRVVVCGGQGPGESITEAEAMKRYLVKQGIDPHRIIKEEHSHNTNENITFATELLGKTNPHVVIVSNNFHLFRAKIIAKRQGVVTYTLAAPTPPMVKRKLFFREYFAIGKTLLFDW